MQGDFLDVLLAQFVDYFGERNIEKKFSFFGGFQGMDDFMGQYNSIVDLPSFHIPCIIHGNQ